MSPHLQAVASQAVAWQKRQPNEVLALELFAFLLLIVLYALKRYITRKRYVPRFMGWLRGKRMAVRAAYDDVMDR